MLLLPANLGSCLGVKQSEPIRRPRSDISWKIACAQLGRDGERYPMTARSGYFPDDDSRFWTGTVFAKKKMMRLASLHRTGKCREADEIFFLDRVNLCSIRFSYHAVGIHLFHSPRPRIVKPTALPSRRRQCEEPRKEWRS